MSRATVPAKKKRSAQSKNTHTRRAIAAKPATEDTSPKGLLPKLSHRIGQFLARRPHRSFQLTRRRDYVRSLKLPGYIAFNREIFSVLNQRRSTFLLLALIYAVATVVSIGLASQTMFNELNDTLQESSQGILEGAWGEVGKIGLLVATSVGGGLYEQLTEIQQLLVVLLFVLLWLTTVWLLRAQLAGRHVRLRDGLYNAGAPIVPMILLVFFFIIQLLPATLAFIAYSAGLSSGFLSDGVVGFIFFIVALLLVVLTLYLTTTTFLSLIVVTLPGMYPWQAIRVAGDLAIGRRLRLLLRLAWLGLCLLIVWVIVLIPIIFFTIWLQAIAPTTSLIPVVPIALLILSSLSAIYVAAYIYLLYRKVVEDDAKPA
ncbi:MAG: hypothetical protein ACSLEY_00045 [Candidatus Saccharimonadales bacterium]